MALAVGASVDSGGPSIGAIGDLAASDDLGDPDEFLADWDPWSVPTAKPGDRMRWLIPGVLAGAVVIVYAMIFLGFLDGGPTPTTSAAPETTIPPTTTAAPATTAPIVTTTVAAAPTTTEATTATTSTTLVDFASQITPSGEAVPLNRLTLRSSSIGPIEFGTPAAEAAGRLLASLREPDTSGVAGSELGLCPGETGFWLRWGELTTVFRGDPENGTFVAYRYATPEGPATSHLELTTLSGLRLDGSVEDLETTYSQFTIRYEDVAGTPHYSVLDGEELLLWGPVSSTEPSGTIEGIHSPEPCTS
ncbi:MAG: hypothetical protein EHM57_03290 [Actinobacteria bacterium]|nr:MAG: hypothetical protein EHM57_03290 [Actinomycetota bacterium]